MPIEMILPAETFRTLRALMRLQPSVGSPMDSKLGLVDKLFPTLGTGEGLHSCVESLMDSKVGLVDELFPALGTFKRPFSCMSPHVAVQFHLVPEAFFALGTFVESLSGVEGFMSSVMASLFEGLLAQWTCKLLLLLLAFSRLLGFTQVLFAATTLRGLEVRASA